MQAAFQHTKSAPFLERFFQFESARSLNDDLALNGPKLWNSEFEDVRSSSE